MTRKWSNPWLIGDSELAALPQTEPEEERVLRIEPIRYTEESNFVVWNPESLEKKDGEKEKPTPQAVNIRCPFERIRAEAAEKFDRSYPGWKTLCVALVDKLPPEGEVPRTYKKKLVIER